MPSARATSAGWRSPAKRSVSAARWPGGRARTASHSSSSASGAGGAGWSSGAAPAATGRRERARWWSSALRCATVSAHARRLLSGRRRGYARSAARQASWKASSASTRPTEAAHSRHMASAWSSRKRWKGGRATPLQRRSAGVREGDAPPQLRRRAVALLAELLAQRVEDGQHVLEPDRPRPGERPARVVHPEDHAVVDVGLAAHALAQREERLVDDLRDHPAEHEPGRVADPRGVQTERGEEALALPGDRVVGRRRAGELDESAARDRRQRVEAHP